MQQLETGRSSLTSWSIDGGGVGRFAAPRGLVWLIASLCLSSGCAWMTSVDVGRRCTPGAASQAGISDAQRGLRPMPNYAETCPAASAASLDRAYESGYASVPPEMRPEPQAGEGWLGRALGLCDCRCSAQ